MVTIHEMSESEMGNQAITPQQVKLWEDSQRLNGSGGCMWLSRRAVTLSEKDGVEKHLSSLRYSLRSLERGGLSQACRRLSSPACGTLTLV